MINITIIRERLKGIWREKCRREINRLKLVVHWGRFHERFICLILHNRIIGHVTSFPHKRIKGKNIFLWGTFGKPIFHEKLSDFLFSMKNGFQTKFDKRSYTMNKNSFPPFCFFLSNFSIMRWKLTFHPPLTLPYKARESLNEVTTGLSAKIVKGTHKVWEDIFDISISFSAKSPLKNKPI